MPGFGMAPQKRPNKLKLIITVVIAVLVLAGSAVYAVQSGLFGGDKSGDSLYGTSDDEESSGNNAIVAAKASDFDVVCEGGTVSNALDFKAAPKPYKVVIFTKYAERGDYYSFNSSAGYEQPFNVTYDSDYAQIAAVACLDSIKGSEKKELDCEYQKDGQPVTVAYYSQKFKLTFRNAKDGKAIGQSSEINGPATRCPVFLSYDSATMSAYASEDDNAVAAAINKLSE